MSTTRTPPRVDPRRAGPPARQESRPVFRMVRPGRRAPAMLLAFLFVMSLFVARLVDLQAINGGALAEAALQQRLQAKAIPAVRGTISDSSGRPLAVSVEVRDITADQTLVEDPAATAAVLAPLLGMEQSALQAKLTGDARFVYLKKGVEPRVWRAIQDWRGTDGNDPVILQSVFSEVRTQRDYPNGSLAANVIGFTNSDGAGAVGLEYGLDAELAGKPGEIAFEQAPTGGVIPGSETVSVEPQQGLGVRLTLDSDLQWVAQNAIAAKVKESGADFGMVVAMEVGTGRILAMASAPTFDPNDPGDVDPAVWQNKPATYAFEPGSTAKVFTMAAVLNDKAATPTTPFVVPPGLPRADHVFTDHTPHGTLQLTLAGVLAQSSNIGTILAAEKLDDGRLVKYLKAFGFGSPTGMQYPGESPGLLPAPDTWSDLTYPSLAFGQGMALTAVQIMAGYAAIANDGVRVPPRLIDAYVGSDGTSRATAAGDGVRVVSAKTARQVRQMMERVVSPDGTAPQTAIPGYRIGGKTGTAERFDAACGCYRGYTASFVGVAPADQPRIVVGAWLDNPVNGRYGGVLAGPVVTDVTTAALQSLGVPPSGSAPSDIPTVPGQ